MSQKVKLIFEAEGSTFDEAQNKFVNLAAEIVMKRFVTPPKIMGQAMGQPFPPSPTVDRPGEPAKRPGGWPKGKPRKPKPEGDTHASPESEAPQEAESPETHASDGEGDQGLSVSADAPAEGAPEVAPQAPQSESPEINALRAVIAKFGKERARECLAEFGVQRLSEMDEEKIEGFIAHCNEILA